MMLKMSQEKIGDALGITFQQVQKYEKGANRIGASRLQHLAHILQVPVAFFFEGAPKTPVADNPDRPVTEFLANPQGLALMTAFAEIGNPRVKSSIVQLVERIAVEYRIEPT
jgi:transcriptional regulator with XRE-family HTH domain